MATLTVRIEESIEINDNPISNSQVETITGVSSVYSRIVTVLHTAESGLLSFGATVEAGTIIDDILLYLRITNKDDTNFVNLRILGTSEEYFVKLEKGDSFILGNSKVDANATGSQSISLGDIEEIKAQADTGSVSLDIFVATL